MLAVLLLATCSLGVPPPEPPEAYDPPVAAEPAAASSARQAPAPEDPAITAAREQMVRTQLSARDIRDRQVLAAMRAVPRHRFVPESQWPWAYDDGALPIGHGQTISQPYIVAFMTQALDVTSGMKVLEIGTGSGYQAAVLSELGVEVYSIEIVQPLAHWADGALRGAGYPVVQSDEGPAGVDDDPRRGAIHLKTGDGYQGWAEHAPFDRVVVTCSPDHVPQPLVDQLAVGGRLLIPVGDLRRQDIVLVEKTARGLSERTILPVMFVPMTGEALEH